jgi:hypothetical protein
MKKSNKKLISLSVYNTKYVGMHDKKYTSFKYPEFTFETVSIYVMR